MKHHIYLAALICVFVTACGFSPVYRAAPSQPSASVQRAFADTFIQSIPEREGQYLYNALLDRLNRTGYTDQPRYILKSSSLKTTSRDLDITENDNTTRAQLRLNIDFSLTDARDPKTIYLSRQIQATTSYNVLSSEFATRVSRQAAQESALNDLADKIVTALALHFTKPR